jgi:hypothetical protein
MDIQLFLTHADDHQPVLPEGIPQGAALHVPRSISASPGSKRLIGIATPADSLPEHRWGIIVPKGPIGDHLLGLIEKLRERRKEQQGDEEPLVYQVDPDMDPSASALWIQREYLDKVERSEEHLPRYLLILGGPELVSWNLQQLLGGEAFVGRLSFPDDEGYTAYVEKVIQWEDEMPAPSAEVLFYTVRDGSRATVEGYQHLMSPSFESARDGNRRGKFPAADIVEISDVGKRPSADKVRDHIHSMLRATESARAGVLFSMSHGLGAPRTGWGSPADQRANQGAMVLDRSGGRLTAADVSTRPFLPGGLWLFFACFGAGTPSHSAYFPWLERLHKQGLYGPAEHVLSALPKPDEPPFVAALPQAALANPEGPLGVIGHVDLAWTWSFLDHELSSSSTVAHRRAERFQGILKALVGGHRLGVAHYELVRYSRAVGAELLTLYGEDARLGIAIDDTTAPAARRARRAGLWMQYQDLSAYVLLGDPAARLPIAQRPPGLLPSKPAGGTTRPVASFSTMEEAVMDRIRGADAPSTIAARHAITEAELERWVSTFLDAGRAR